MKRLAIFAAAIVAVFASGIEPLLAQVKIVTVTAQKRAEDVQDVPLPMTAFSGDFLEDSGLDNLTELTTYTPNFRVEVGNNPRNSTISIRGVGTGAGNAGIDQSVGIYLDGVYIPRLGSILSDLVDISTVEVLRGPQGTLYGRNTPVGALNINTKRPSQEFDAFVKAGFGNYDQRNVHGYINGGITDSLAARFTFWASDFAGYEKNLATSTGHNSRENFGGRLKFLWTASDTLDVQVALDYNKMNTVCCLADWYYTDLVGINMLNQMAVNTGIPLATMLRSHSNGRDRVIATGGNQNNRDEQFGISVNVDQDLSGALDGHTLSSVTSFRHGINDANVAQGDIYVDIQNAELMLQQNTTSQEFHLNSPDGGVDFFAGTRLEYVLGAYFYKEVSKNEQLLLLQPAAQYLPTIVASSSMANPAVNFVGPQDNNLWIQHARSWAFFGQSQLFLIPDKWSITGGLRYAKDKKRAYMESRYLGRVPTTVALVNTNFNPISFIRKPENDSITWLASTKYYVTPDIMTYFTASTGYKSSGVNARPLRRPTAVTSTQAVSFGPEHSMTYELGVKTTLFDDTLVFNAGVFRMIVSEMQQNIATPGIIGTYTDNAGRLRQQGVEVDAQYSPNDWFTARGTMAYLQSRWLSYTNGPCDAVAFNPLIVNPGGNCTYDGLENSNSPKWAGSLMTQVTFPLLNTSLEWYARGEWNYMGHLFKDSSHDIRSEMPRYHLFNSRIGIKGNDGDWELALWGKNLTNLVYFVTEGGGQAFAGLSGSRERTYAPPRTFGLEGSIHF